MSEYSVLLTKFAAKQLDKLPETIADSLIEMIQSLAKNPRPVGAKKIKRKRRISCEKGRL